MATLSAAASGEVAGAVGQGLLTALVGFMQPIIRAYAGPPSGSMNSSSDNNLGLTCSAREKSPSNDTSEAIQLGNGIEGQKLLRALDEFIKATIYSPPFAQEEIIRPPNTDDLNNQATTISTPTLIPTPSAQTPSDSTGSLQLTILATLRSHVFNKMPIRLLAFDATGAGLRLIERSEMFSRVLQSAYAGAREPQFVADWRAAEQMERHDSFARRESMIEELVAHHARYAILSHTWLRDTPGDVVYGDWAARADNRRGLAKIARFCEVAARDHGVAFGWMDTVCINKDSSSELDESIRSMYKWYRAAHVCVTYLAETRAVEDMQDDPWFTRGWTLQELLAPRDVQFYDMNWENFLREGDDPGLPTAADIQEQIEEATTITEDELQLCRSGDTEKIPISRRLQLAAERQVTREEDTAYSLMGLLGVDISVAYGEGAERAFFRLVRELLNTKKHVLDIFNHSYYLNLKEYKSRFIPSSIEQYKRRTAFFDVSGRNIASLLDRWQPPEPIILTHLGVRVPLLLVPALNVSQSSSPTSNVDYVAQGDYSGRILLVHIWSEGVPYGHRYNLLDDRIYSDDDYHQITPSEPIVSKYAPAPHIATFGVLNFTVDGQDILLPHSCFSVPLDCGDCKPGEVRPSDNIRILATHEAPVFQLESVGNNNRIPQDELENHGMQLIILYLR